MIQAKLADMYVGVETIKGLAYKALAAVNDLEAGAGGRGEVHKLCAAALLHAAEACSKIASDAEYTTNRRTNSSPAPRVASPSASCAANRIRKAAGNTHSQRSHSTNVGDRGGASVVLMCETRAVNPQPTR